jgi:glucose-6-phosphate isomerase
LAEHGKPNGTLTIPEINETSVGSLVGFFMIATSVMGDLLKIDPYNQPGVETGKQKMFAALGRDGF